MYWTDWEEDEIDDSVGRIEKAWMDGYSRQIFVTSKMLWPNGLTLDYHANVLYWCDAYYDHIERIFLNGTERKVKKNTAALPQACSFSGLYCVMLKMLFELFSLHNAAACPVSSLLKQVMLAASWRRT